MCVLSSKLDENSYPEAKCLCPDHYHMTDYRQCSPMNTTERRKRQLDKVELREIFINFVSYLGRWCAKKWYDYVSQEDIRKFHIFDCVPKFGRRFLGWWIFEAPEICTSLMSDYCEEGLGCANGGGCVMATSMGGKMSAITCESVPHLLSNCVPFIFEYTRT